MKNILDIINHPVIFKLYFPGGSMVKNPPEKRRTAPGERAPSLWPPGPLAAEGKGVSHRGRGRQNLWLPGQNTASAPHTQRHLPAAPRPPRSRTELN